MRRLLAFQLVLAFTLFTLGPPPPADLDAPPPGNDAGAMAPGQRSQLEREVMAMEYHATPTERGLQAPNRANDLRTWFGPEGIRVANRTEPGPADLLAMRTVRFGREGRMRNVAPGEVTHRESRVEIRREGLIEWYENRPEGLEQGFTLATRPTGDGMLRLELAVEGATPSAEDGVIRLACAGGRELTYSKLVAIDAHGAELPASFTADAGIIALAVVDEGAAYPITIDPLLRGQFEAQLTSPQTDGHFGWFLSGAGDVNGDGYADLMVGSEDYDFDQTSEGAVFLYLGSATGIANGAAPSATFQSNVVSGFLGRCAAAGDVNGDGYDDIMIAARGVGFGSVYIFHGGPAGIASGSPATAQTTLSSTTAISAFGISVAGAGDVNGDGYSDVIVGAQDFGNNGAAFLYMGSATGVPNGNTTNAPTILQCAQANASFGFSVAGAGDVNADGYDDVIVGAYRYDFTISQEGGAFVFHGGPSGIASGSELTANSKIAGGQANSNFGIVVAGAGDLFGDGHSDVIVVASAYDVTATNEGAAFIFDGSNAGICDVGPASFCAEVILRTNQASATVTAAAGVGDVNGDGYADVMMGSQLFDNNQIDEGRVWVFLGGPQLVTSPPGTAAMTLEPNQASANMNSVAGVGDVNGDGFDDVIVGARLWDGTNTNQGAAWVYHGSNRGLISGSDLNNSGHFESNVANSGAFMKVASAGDVNGDGWLDVMIGLPEWDDGQTNEGAVFLFLGASNGIGIDSPAQAETYLQGDQAGANFGMSLASAGDVNGDGYGDIIVGAPGYTSGQTNEGAAFLFLGSASGIASGSSISAATLLQSDEAAAGFGTSVAGAGDVNGDGFAEVIVGAVRYGPTDAGGAFVYHGGAAGIPNSNAAGASTVIVSNQAGAEVGTSVAGAGDVNGDGYADVIVGAPFYDEGSTDEGAAFLFHGGPSGVPSGANAELQSNEAGARLGISVAGAGDVNGDGYADVIVGADHYGASDFGAAFVFHGGPTGTGDGSPANADATLTTTLPNAFAGTCVAGAGDVDGDGYTDVIVGAPNYGTGHAWLWAGSAGGVGAAINGPIADFASNQAGTQFGTSIVGVGDVNGDGFADVMAAAPLYDAGQIDEGTAYLFKDLYSRRVHARQLRADGSGRPVPAWGEAHFAGFRVAMDANHTRARGRLKLEVERCPSTADFGTGNCTRTTGPWVDSGSDDQLTPLQVDLAPGAGLHHWRARVLRARYSATSPGITISANPPHGPWRRFDAQVLEADIRILPTALAVEDPEPSGTSFAIRPLQNPARGQILLSAFLPEAGAAELEIFDVAGRRRLEERLTSAGPGAQTFRLTGARDLESGVYMVRLVQGAHAATSRLVFIR